MDTSQTTPAATPPEDILGRILDEVEQGKNAFASPLGDGATSSAAANTAGNPIAADNPIAAGNPLASLLGGVVSNPALLSALPTLLEQIGPLLSGASGSPSVEKTSAAHNPSARRVPMDRHTALLCAVKPYLNADRQATVDTVIRLCRVWDALERAGISPGGLLTSLGSMTGSRNAATEASASEQEEL